MMTLSLLCCFLFAGPTATYIANEGVMIQGAGGAVLIDAIHHQGNPLYLPVADETLNAIRSGAPPYDQVDLVLVTHEHADHFDAQAVADHLRANTNAVLIAPPDVAQAVGDLFPGARRGRIRPLFPEPGQTIETQIGTIDVTVMNLPHGSGRFADIQNVGYVITVDGTRWLHVGDADLNRATFDAYAEPLRGVDVALLPEWYTTQGRGKRLIDELIQPGLLVSCHVPPKDADQKAKQLNQTYPDAVLFSKPGQTVQPTKD